MTADRAASHAYTRESGKRDAGLPHVRPELAAQRAAQDVAMEERHRMFDLSAQDTRMKYERARFSVVGEGTKQATNAYRDGWERIFGSNKKVTP